jgi:glucose/arabinose dehydrogenase
MPGHFQIRPLACFPARASLLLASLSGAAQLIAASIVAAEGVAVIRVATGLEQPVYVTAPPGDNSRLFIVEANSGGSPNGPRVARIRILNLTGSDAGTVNEIPFLTVAGIRQVEDHGLFTLAFHPKYAQNGYFYINHTTSDGMASVIERYQVSAADPNLADEGSKTLIMSVPEPFLNHNGDWIGFSPTDVTNGNYYLYYTTGDGGSQFDPDNRAQNLSLRNGKLLRIDVGSDGLADDFPFDLLENYAIPASNPFVGTPGADPAIWASGFRNPWRASFDRQTGDVYIGDVGQGIAEEVNFQPFDSAGGENYGWSRLEGTAAGPNPTPVLMSSVAPMYEYRHGFSLTSGPGRSVTGGYVYRGPVAELQGQYIFADFLGDYDFTTRTGHAQIFSFQFEGSDPSDFDGSNIVDDQVLNRTVEFQPNVGTIDFISSFGEDAMGNLYIVDMGNLGTPDGLGLGEIYQIVPQNLAIGDYNNDDVVDAADYVVWRNDPNQTHVQYSLWRANFGRTATVAAGDFNGNGVVDAADYVVWRKTDGTAAGYNAWRTHFGQPAGAPASASGSSPPATAVPEPASSVLLTIATAGLCLRRRRAA